MNEELERVGLIICTTGKRPEQLHRCVVSHMDGAADAGINLVNRVYQDSEPSPSLRHLVKVRNAAMDACKERWAFVCDDDDHVFRHHVKAMLAARTNYPSATVIMGQAIQSPGVRRGFTMSCSLINLDRFNMVRWQCPHEGGEDFYTLSTLEARCHLVIREPLVTWTVCDDVPSLTRDARIELAKEKCELPDAPWQCSRAKGHQGPCAARLPDARVD